MQLKRRKAVEPKSKEGKFRKFAKRCLLGLGLAGIAGGAAGGMCAANANRFDAQRHRVPCAQLELPEAAGSKVLEKHLCVSVAGEQPQKVGVERTDLESGKIANMLFLEWDFDGFAESPRALRKSAPDAEPITLITGADGTPLSFEVRSHWRVGRCDPREMLRRYSKARIAVTNAFHTPVIVGCDAEVLDPMKRGSVINTTIFRTVVMYAKAVGNHIFREFTPLRGASKNEVPGEDHPARTQPLYLENQ